MSDLGIERPIEIIELVARHQRFPAQSRRVTVREGEICQGCRLPTDVVVVVPDGGGGAERSCRLCAAVGHLEDAGSGWATLSGGPKRTAGLVAATRLLPVVSEIAVCDLEKFPLHGADLRLNAALSASVKTRCAALRDVLTSFLDEARNEAVTAAVTQLMNTRDGDAFESQLGPDVALLPPRASHWVVAPAPTVLLDPLRKEVIRRIVQGERAPMRLPAPRMLGSHLPSFSRSLSVTVLVELARQLGFLNTDSDVTDAKMRTRKAIDMAMELEMPMDEEGRELCPSLPEWCFGSDATDPVFHRLRLFLRETMELTQPDDGVPLDMFQAAFIDMTVWDAVMGGQIRADCLVAAIKGAGPDVWERTSATATSASVQAASSETPSGDTFEPCADLTSPYVAAARLLAEMARMMGIVETEAEVEDARTHVVLALNRLNSLEAWEDFQVADFGYLNRSSPSPLSDFFYLRERPKKASPASFAWSALMKEGDYGQRFLEMMSHILETTEAHDEFDLTEEGVQSAQRYFRNISVWLAVVQGREWIHGLLKLGEGSVLAVMRNIERAAGISSSRFSTRTEFGSSEAGLRIAAPAKVTSPPHEDLARSVVELASAVSPPKGSSADE